MAISFVKFLIAFAAVCLSYWAKQFYDGSFPNSDDFLKRVNKLSTNMVIRMAQSIGLQALKQSPTCDKSSEVLKNQVIFLTGGNRGIGFETALGLYQRGAHVLMTCRKIEECETAKDRIYEKGSSQGSISVFSLELSDMESLKNFSVKFGEYMHSNNLKLHQVIFNAAVWPNSYSESAQGYELAFATNTLAPFALFQLFHSNHILSENAKIILVSGDIYIIVKGTKHEGCSPDFKYTGDAGNAIAYSRSKLGLMWIHSEIHRRFPNYQVNTVHPGVIDNSLAGANSGKLPKFFLLTNEEGAQTTLIVATSVVENGAYFHNGLGKVVFSENDPAIDTKSALSLWENLTSIYEQHFSTA